MPVLEAQRLGSHLAVLHWQIVPPPPPGPPSGFESASSSKAAFSGRITVALAVPVVTSTGITHTQKQVSQNTIRFDPKLSGTPSPKTT